MAEYVEVMEQKKRMCNSTLCCECDIFHLSGEDINNCSQFISNNPSKAEKIIMSWAAEHPAPKYPTWMEYLFTIYDTVWPQIATMEIPDDIAEKLGIEPKEGV